MARIRTAGAIVSMLALAAYAAGTAVSYPGRAFSLTVLMVGLTLLVVGGDGW